ncbi:MAG: low molecular weight phosphatase family protein [Anaerolineales bacterium]
MILFLCTGNYYRSRLAEELFNHFAAHAGNPMRATSRGIAQSFTAFRNVGSISPHVIQQLGQRGILPLRPNAPPQSLTETDLQTAARVIALCQSEHYPMMQQRFPQWAERITYWHIPDHLEMPVPQAAAQIEAQVRTLLANLS